MQPETDPVARALARYPVQPPLAVAFSGGADSTALLLACVARWPGQVRAIHVHHGLQQVADAFVRHCEALCVVLGVPLQVERVNARHAPGESPEDVARRARYAALASAAQHMGVHDVLLGQHADDQAETLLLALSRGAGLPGLAAMAPAFVRHGVRFHRPLLALGGAVLRQNLRERGVAWIEDPTNTNTALTRNRIRHQLLPALEQAFPGFRETFARSARHAAQAQELLDALAVADLAATGNPPALRALQALPRARQANLLRHWLRQSPGGRASAAQLEELLDQVAACTTRGHSIRIKVGAGRIERAGEALAFIA